MEQSNVTENIASPTSIGLTVECSNQRLDLSLRQQYLRSNLSGQMAFLLQWPSVEHYFHLSRRHARLVLCNP